MSGYTKKVPVGIEIEAQMLEVAAGWEDEHKVDAELAFATSMLDEKDPDSLRWLTVCVAAKLDYLEASS